MSRKDNEKKETKPRKTEETSIGREIWEYVKMIAIVVAVVVFVEQVIVINARIPSPSMENTIMTGDQIFGNRLAYVKSDPQRYDIVIFYYPDDEKQKFIKRVIGLPGETVTIRDGKVYINDSTEPLRDDFCFSKTILTVFCYCITGNRAILTCGTDNLDHISIILCTRCLALC